LAGHVSGLALLFIALQLVHQIDGVAEAHAVALVNGGHAQNGGEVSFAGPGAAHPDHILRCVHEGSIRQQLGLCL